MSLIIKVKKSSENKMNFNYEDYSQSEIEIIMVGLNNSTIKTQPEGWASPGKIERVWDRYTFDNIKNEAEQKELENIFKEKLNL